LLADFESQSTLIGNSINIAGKNRFLTSNVILEAERYLGGRLEVSKLNEAIAELDSNIRTLRTGGVIAETELRPLPSEYVLYWGPLQKMARAARLHKHEYRILRKNALVSSFLKITF
jgi:hypothetical protein